MINIKCRVFNSHLPIPHKKNCALTLTNRHLIWQAALLSCLLPMYDNCPLDNSAAQYKFKTLG